MKKLLVICLALALFASMGCGNKPETDENDTTTQAGAVSSVSLTDPVDGTRIENFETAKHSFVYNGVEYRFNSKENYEAFKKDPAKYVSK
ncbi:MAG: YHS domain-containing protein [Candidatus Krumholzibacteria bacterium]|nr:YHS domain-containing protein [Candidatus Krumholzibacteria bacterium]